MPMRRSRRRRSRARPETLESIRSRAFGPIGDLAAAAAEGEQVRDAGELVKHATEPPGKG